MNVNIYYKNETLAIKVQPQINIRKLYEFSIKKFDQSVHQELLMFDLKLQLRLIRTNSILHFNDIVGSSLKENDMVIIELKENLTRTNQRQPSQKKHDLSHIYNNSPASLKKIENDASNISKDLKQHSHSTDLTKESQHYQNSEASPGFCKKSKSQFGRCDLRRSLGADIAPQFDIEYYNVKRNDNSSTNYDSQSSLSDFSNLNKDIQRHYSQNTIGEYEKQISKSAPVSPTKSASFPRSQTSMLNSYNVRTIGNKITLSLLKKPKIGLGFTIVTRDNQVLYGSAADIANSVVILVNKILPDGGAAEDNKLRPGDRLLEVNGVSIKSLKEATDTLRAIPENCYVKLLISRVDQYENDSKEHLSESNLPQISMKDIIVDIRLNKNKNEKQQLGLNIISHKDYEKFPMGSGVYIHSIVPNSLVSQQGGLKINDKLISINGYNLNDINVKETICHLQKVMESETVLTITVCRIMPMELESYRSGIKKNEETVRELDTKLSHDRKGRDSTDSHSNVYSSDSLSNNYQLDETIPAFERESKGRRSMSDKRKAHEDASQYAFYQETRLNNINTKDDRMYSTLPTSSRLKKLITIQSPCITNKIQGPIKPSQMKLLNTPKIPQEQSNKTPNTSHRSYSLRNSPTKLSEQIIDIPHNHKHVNQSLPSAPLSNINRSMNNSFKKAVHKAHVDNGQTIGSVKSIENVSKSRQDSKSVPKLIENTYQTLSSTKGTGKVSRSHSAKASEKKKKSFNLKNFLTFTSNINQPISKKKSDTFPLSKQSRSEKSRKIHTAELTLNQTSDHIILDSTKRVLEWHKKNKDAIINENKIKEKKPHKATSIASAGTFKTREWNPFRGFLFSCCTASSKKRVDTSPRSKTPVAKVIKSHINNHSGYETDPYESITGVLSCPIVKSVHRSSQPRQISSNNHSRVVLVSSKNQVNSKTSRNTHTLVARKISLPNETNITKIKGPTKENKSQREISSASLSHIHKYKF